MNRPPGVWVTGPSRSGTSLTAGLFAAHGVFWGRKSCEAEMPADRHNQRGYYEHPEIVHRLKDRDFSDWPEAWWAALRADGWDGESPWGFKRGPAAADWVRPLRPSIVVVTHRPARQVAESRRRWKGRASISTMRKTERRIREALRTFFRPVYRVDTAELVRGDYSGIRPAFAALGVQFSEAIAEEWIDPSLWNRGSP